MVKSLAQDRPYNSEGREPFSVTRGNVMTMGKIPIAFPSLSPPSPWKQR